MTELGYFLKFLNKRRYILLTVPAVALVVAFLITRQMSDTYLAEGRIATGIVDQTDKIITVFEISQESAIDREFDNLIQFMRMKKVMDQVSYRLLIHDLTVPADSAFRPASKELEEMSAANKKRLLNLLQIKHASGQQLSAGVPGEVWCSELMESMGYDGSSLLEDMEIYRVATSDYIKVTFEAEKPLLASFVVNTHSDEFLRANEQRLVESSNRSLEFLEKLMGQKLDTLNRRMQELKNYKTQNKIFNLDEQAKGMYGHIIDFETRREIAKQEAAANRAALRNIDKRFDPSDRRYVESALSDVNQRIAITKQRLQSTNDRYIQSNFDPGMKSRVDSLQEVLNEQIRESTDKNIYSPLSAKANLVNRKLELEIALELAENSISSIESEVSRLNRQYNGLAPNEANIQQFETSIEIASKEYMEALQRYNEARLESYSPSTLKVVEKAGPGEKQPSKKMIVTLMAAVASLLFCVFVFFVMYFLDNSVRTTAQLADVSGMPVLGRLNQVPGGKELLYMDTSSSPSNGSLALFRDLIRSIRYEIDEDVSGPKIIAVTSLRPQSGKTDFIYALAWAYARINHRVLIIDGNSSHPDISKQAESDYFIERVFKDIQEVVPSGQVSTISTFGGDTSLLEIADEVMIQKKLSHLKQQFDTILVEIPALTELNKAKEWIALCDRVVPVFTFGEVLKDADRTKLDYLKSRNGHLAGWVLTGTNDDIEPIGKTLTKL